MGSLSDTREWIHRVRPSTVAGTVNIRRRAFQLNVLGSQGKAAVKKQDLRVSWSWRSLRNARRRASRGELWEKRESNNTNPTTTTTTPGNTVTREKRGAGLAMGELGPPDAKLSIDRRQRSARRLADHRRLGLCMGWDGCPDSSHASIHRGARVQAFSTLPYLLLAHSSLHT